MPTIHRGAAALGLLAIAAVAAVVVLSGDASQPSSLLIWGPPTIRPAPQATAATEASRLQSLVEHSKHNGAGKEAARKLPSALVVNQNDNSNSPIAPVPTSPTYRDGCRPLVRVGSRSAPQDVRLVVRT